MSAEEESKRETISDIVAEKRLEAQHIRRVNDTPGGRGEAYDLDREADRIEAAAKRCFRVILVIPPWLAKETRKDWPVTTLVEAQRLVPGVLGPGFGDCVFKMVAPDFLRHIRSTDPDEIAAWLCARTRGPADAVLVPETFLECFRTVRRRMVTDIPFLYYTCTGYVELLEDAAPPVPDYD